jgi:ArsR family transcriptional regulator
MNVDISCGKWSGSRRRALAMANRCGPARGGFTADLSMEEAFFKALADEHRLRILATISRAGEVCVCDLTDALPLLQPTVSHHLKVLRDAGLVVAERRGTWVYYRLHPQAETRWEQMTRKVFKPKVRLTRTG